MTGYSNALPVRVGIDDVNVHAGLLAITSHQLARARGFGERELRIAQFEARSVLPPLEDPVTLAVNAARPLIGGGRSEIELLIVATETGLDFAKAMSTYVHRHLDLSPQCRNFEIKHACYAGTAALFMAAGWVAQNPGKRALVICTDVARRHFGDPSELTAGSGAVAFTVASDPRVLALDAVTGRSTHEVYDVARPTATVEFGDAGLSLASYLDLLELAAGNYKRAAGIERLHDGLSHFIFHSPLISLVEKAYGTLCELDDPESTDPAVQAGFVDRVEPGLRHNRQLGNLYSGSIFASLAALAENPALGGEAHVGIYSYGSGACAEFYSGYLVGGAAAVVSRHEIGARLRQRALVSCEEYERGVHAFEASLLCPEYRPDVPTSVADLYAGRDLLVLDGIRNHHRTYRWSGQAQLERR